MLCISVLTLCSLRFFLASLQSLDCTGSLGNKDAFGDILNELKTARNTLKEELSQKIDVSQA